MVATINLTAASANLVGYLSAWAQNLNYVVRLLIAKTGADRVRDLEMVPGMPVETMIKTRDRTALSYVLKPLSDQIARAFREN